MTRKHNFYAGPSTLPTEVLDILSETIGEYHEMGLSIIETSHRSSEYENVHNEAIELFRELFSVPGNFHILLLGGGATLQFSMVPMNLIGRDGACDFVISGEWAKKALSDAEKIGTARVIYSGKDSDYKSLPESLACNEDSTYVHITSNETINGVQWPAMPANALIPIVADMSSDILSRAVSWSDIGLVYAGAQKNLGPAGVTLVIIRDDLLARCDDSLTAYLSYKNHAEKNSLYNTPPVFSIYALKLVMDWVKWSGGVDAMEKASKEKAERIYMAIDSSGGFYSNDIDERFRSRMNVVFNLRAKNLESRFLEEAGNAGMVGLKGHRSVGGFRASLYNALPIGSAERLAGFMNEFALKNG